MLELRFTGPMWRVPGGDWRFITLPQDANEVLHERGVRPGFGSVRVEVQVGATRWATSVFPDSGRGAYVLPVKKAVRDAEGIRDGDEVSVVLRLPD